MSAKNMRIIAGEDFIQIVDEGTEVVYWDRQEWVENPDVVFTITEAIALSFMSPDTLREIHKGHMEAQKDDV